MKVGKNKMRAEKSTYKVQRSLVDYLEKTPYREVSVSVGSPVYVIPQKLYFDSIEAARLGGEYLLDYDIRESEPSKDTLPPIDWKVAHLGRLETKERKVSLNIPVEFPMFPISAYEPERSIDHVCERVATRMHYFRTGEKPPLYVPRINIENMKLEELQPLEKREVVSIEDTINGYKNQTKNYILNELATLEAASSENLTSQARDFSKNLKVYMRNNVEKCSYEEVKFDYLWWVLNEVVGKYISVPENTTDKKKMKISKALVKAVGTMFDEEGIALPIM